jgi:hypothetical protein
MDKETFVLFATFFDKHEFETIRDILMDAGIEFWASNRAPSVNFKVPGSAFTEIELHIAEEDLDKVASLIEKKENGS